MVKCTNKIIILILLTLLSVFILSSGITVCYAASSDTFSFDEMYVLDDLKTASINGKAFDISDYISDSSHTSSHPELLTLVEYCYSFRNGQNDNYGIYLYIYNPQQLNIESNTSVNKVTLAVKYGEDNNGNVKVEQYEKFGLKLCSKSTGEYRDLFYKFKVIDHKSSDGKYIKERVEREARRYDLSEIELLTYGDKNATAYGIGGTYIFEGFAKGYGADQSAESTLTCTRNDIETIILDLAGKTDGVDKRTYWRSQSSDMGKNYQNQINSVFFAIDSNLLERYGYVLQRITAEWFEAITAPIVVVNPNTYSELVNFKGVNNPNYDKCLIGENLGNYVLSFGWNAPTLKGSTHLLNYARYTRMLPFLFSSGNKTPDEAVISSSQLEEYIESYDNSYQFGTFIRNYSRDLFITTKVSNLVYTDELLIDSGHLPGLNTYEFDITNPDDLWQINDYDSTHNWLDKLLDYGLNKIDTNDGRENILPIQMLTDDDFADGADDLTISNNLLVNEEDVEILRNFYIDSTADKNNDGKRDKEVFLFRFSQTNYYAEDIYLLDRETVKQFAFIYPDPCGEVRQETLFFDFDIMSMTFNKNGDLTTLGCVSSPVDHIADLTPSIEGVTPDWVRILKIIIGLIILIVVIILLYPILTPIISALIKGLIWLVTLPFKAIGHLIRVKKKKGDKPINSNEVEKGSIYKTTDGYLGNYPSNKKTRRIVVVDQRPVDGALAVSKIYKKRGKYEKNCIEGLVLKPENHSSLTEESIVAKRVIFGVKENDSKKPIYKRDLEETGDQLTKSEYRKLKNGVGGNTRKYKNTLKKTTKRWKNRFK